MSKHFVNSIHFESINSNFPKCKQSINLTEMQLNYVEIHSLITMCVLVTNLYRWMKELRLYLLVNESIFVL